MSGPDRPIAADWLALRRVADTAARDGAGWLVRACADALAVDGRVLSAIDVGAGTGANQAYLAPRLGLATRWVLLDHDSSLLAAAGNDGAVRLVGGIEQLDAVVAATPKPRLVTCSALLDLLTTDQLDELALVLARHAVPGLFSLTVDGFVDIVPSHCSDESIAAAFNDHQSRAGCPGPDAANYFSGRCERLGLSVISAATPWLLDADAAPLIGRLLSERAAAAVEQRPGLADTARRWLDDRLHCLAAGDLQMRVAHRDLLIQPTGSAEDQLRAHVVAQHESTVRPAFRVGDTFDRRHPDAWNAGAEQEGSGGQIQPVEGSRSEEGGHGAAPALHQHPFQAALAERVQYLFGAPGAGTEPYLFDVRS